MIDGIKILAISTSPAVVFKIAWQAIQLFPLVIQDSAFIF